MGKTGRYEHAWDAMSIESDAPQISSGGRLYDDAEPSPPPRPKDANPSPKKTHKQRNWRGMFSDFAELAGIGAISAGCWQITPSAGLIAGGVGLVLVGIGAARGA